MLTQRPVVRRILPLEVEETTEAPPEGPLPYYEFEPTAGDVLDRLLPRYIESRIFNALLQSAVSEHAARRRAMKSAVLGVICVNKFSNGEPSYTAVEQPQLRQLKGLLLS